jgi:hypothetical protein
VYLPYHFIFVILFPSAESATFDGAASVVTMKIDRTKFGFGETGSLTFRTRDVTSTLLLIEFRALAGGTDQFLEVRLYQGRVQVYSSFSQGA